MDDITDMRRSCRLRENTSVRRPLGSSSRLLKVPNNTEDPAELKWTSAIKKVWAKDRKNRLEEAETLRYSYSRRYNWAKQINDLIEKMISWIQGRNVCFFYVSSFCFDFSVTSILSL